MNKNERDTTLEEQQETPKEACNAETQPAADEGASEMPSETAELTKEQKEILELKQNLEDTNAKLKDITDKYLRTLAEYDNYRKRSQKEKDSVYNESKAAAVTVLLPIYDNLQRALLQETEDAAFYKGVEMTMSQCKAAFEKLGVAELPALGQPFDPNFHNAVMHVEDENAGENTVVEVFQSGFALGDKVIRCAMVKVAN
ncbi:MAG: nucleotide exchange factor GrpE [Oscillospiraceae bacterium]|nr:nucleotide exchange factor GrpE [Oscillospiraceae bacterium]